MQFVSRLPRPAWKQEAVWQVDMVVDAEHAEGVVRSIDAVMVVSVLMGDPLQNLFV
jgi:hypothetical protein